MTASRKQGIVLMSGGIDSAACAHLLLRRGIAVQAVFIDYGQASAQPESRAVAALASHMQLSLARYAVSGSAPFPSGELVGRNAFLIFAALLLTHASPGLLAMGIHTGTTYYDCSRSFIDSMAKIVAEHTDGQVAVVAPFHTWSKSEVYNYFVSAGLPLHLTYSCEAGTEPPCGECASCRDRKVLGC